MVPAKSSLRICYLAFPSIHTRRCLEWFVKKGHKVFWLTHRPEFIPGVEMFDIGYKTIFGNRLKRLVKLNLNIWSCRRLRLFFKVRKIIQDIKPHILHLHTLYFPSYSGVFSGFRPMLISPWNGDVLWSNPRPFYYRRFVRYALKKADAITSDNLIMKDTCIRYGVTMEKINVIRWFGADTQTFRPIAKDNQFVKFKQSLGIDKDDPVVLSMRSVAGGYNIDVIVRSIPLVLKEIPQTKFIFIWPGGDQIKVIEDLIQFLGIKEAVRLIGKIDDYSRIPWYYNLADVAVSIASPDSTPASLLEAMACGVACIVSNEKAITEFIQDGWNGVVVPARDEKKLAEAILRLLRNKKERKFFAQRNLSLVQEKGDYHQEMEKLEKLYYSLVSPCLGI